MTQITETIQGRTSDIFHSQYRPLQPLFSPRAIAVLGTTFQVGSVSHGLLWNLINAPFQGAIFAVTADGPDSLHTAVDARLPEMPIYANLNQLPDQVDLAIIIAPLEAIPPLLQSCIAANVPNVVLTSAGFRESGTMDSDLELKVQQLVATHPIRLLGPNSLGLMVPRHGLNATLASTMARPGNIAFISQSGALCRAILDWSFREQVGFSAFVSTGSMLDIGWGDLIRHLGSDPYTESILIHMESVGDASAFLAAAREVALTKPIILLKGGRTAGRIQAADFHDETDMEDAVFTAALQRCGVLQVNRISELFNAAEVLAKRKFQVQGPRLGVITNSGGLGILVADALAQEGGQLAPLGAATFEQLDQVLPREWSHQNPIDILGDATGSRYQQVLTIAAEDPNVDGILVILTPQRADPTDTAEKLVATVARLQKTTARSKPILASWMGGAEVLAGEAILNRHQIPTYGYPDSAARLFHLMWRHSYSLQGLYETPMSRQPSGSDWPVERVIRQARHDRRSLLTQVEALQILSAYGLPVNHTELVTSAEAAAAKADMLGYPVVLKLPFKPGSHTPDESGIQLNLNSPEAVKAAFRRLVRGHTPPAAVVIQSMLQRDGRYELMISSAIDPLFGPVIRFGQGGRLHEVQQDYAVALPPLTHKLARRLIAQTRIFQALAGDRGYPAVHLRGLENLLVRFSQLVVEQPQIQAIDINPLWITPDWQQLQQRNGSSPPPQLPQLMILDACIGLHPLNQDSAQLPRPAIQPYPTEYIHRPVQGEPITLRPLLPQDRQRVANFYQALTAAPPQPWKPLPPLDFHSMQTQLTRLCCLDYDRELAIAALGPTAAGDTEILAIGRLSHGRSLEQAEFALLARPQQPLLELLRHLIRIAAVQGVESLFSYLDTDYPELEQACRQLGFEITYQPEGVLAAKTLNTSRK